MDYHPFLQQLNIQPPVLDALPEDDEETNLKKLKSRMCLFLDGEMTAQLNCLEAEMSREELAHDDVKKNRIMERLKMLLPDFAPPSKS